MRDINKEVMALLDKYGADYKRALKENKKVEYLYALSELRENLLEWYEFKKEASLLQVGADFGALTGLFSRRVKNVVVMDERDENLEVVKKRFERTDNVHCVKGSPELWGKDAELPERPEDGFRGNGYDYVVLVGLQSETCEAQIEAAKGLLLPGGTLILAACNRFGMKYFAGAKKDSCTATKRELESLLPGGAFYYPMPDYRIASTVYSEKYLPKKGDLTNILTAYDYPKYLLMDVGAAFDAVCEDGQFENFANSFLVMWEKGE